MEKKEIIEEIKSCAQEIQNVVNAAEGVILNGFPYDSEYSLTVDYLNSLAGKLRQHVNGLKGYSHVDAANKSKVLSGETKNPLAAEEVANPDTPFFGKKVVFTGNLSRFPKREEIAATLRRYGADINTSISRLTDFVIMGSGAGPSKLRKIETLQINGAAIKVLNEQDFIELLEKFDIK